MVKAVVGANWGDEGKGKITDMLAKQADIIAVSYTHLDVYKRQETACCHGSCNRS